LLDYLERIGLDSQAMAMTIGLSPRVLRGLSPDEPLPAQQYSMLYKAAVAGMQGLGRPLPWAAGLGSEAFELMCHCMISGRTLGDALHLASRFDSLLYPIIGYRVSLDEDGGNDLVKLCYEVDPRLDRSELVPSQWDRADSGATVSRASGLLVWHSLCGWLIGQAIEAREMRVAAPFVSQEYYDGLAAVFHCPIYFDADESCFSFGRDVLARRLVHTVDSLKGFLDNAVYQLMEMEREPASTSAAIKSIVTIELPGSMPSFSEIARTLHMSESSLRRRLQRENTSYQALKDEVRCEVAISKLINEDAKVADLADYLGFTEPSSFVRSFKSWTGKTPSSYRDSMVSLAGA
jgi:AraC-like DNA-binding protein